MAKIVLNKEKVDRNGINLADTGSLVATTNTYQFKPDSRSFLNFKKSGAGACTVTFITPGKVDGLDIGDKTLTVPASTGDVLVACDFPDAYVDDEGYVGFTLSEVTGLTVALGQLNT